MKRWIARVLTLIFLVGTAAGCGHSGNTFLKEASPETSALALYCYDGEEVRREFLFDVKEIKEVLKELSAVDIKPAEGWTPKDVEGPVYGVEIGRKDGYTLFGAWSNGYWITEEGEAYEFAYDFEQLEAGHEWTNGDVFHTINVLPCARHLVQNGDEWNSTLLTPAEEGEVPEDISIKITEQSEKSLKAEIINNRQEEWMFGEYFSLEVDVDGEWCQVPTAPGNWAFTDIGLVLLAGQTMEKEYSFEMYGELPAGNYRLVVENITAEFTVE